MRPLTRLLKFVLLALTLFAGSGSAWALKCDVDNNGRIDRIDLNLIQSAILSRAPVTGPDDARDPDNNNVINSIDGRICALRCKYASCATNGAPTANAGPDQTARVGDTVRLTGAASSDPDGNPLSYRWTLTGRPAGSAAAFAGATTASPSFVADRAGSYTASLIVNDGTVDGAADTVTVTVSATNSPPTANAGPDQTARVGDTVRLTGAASSDPDDNPLSYRWTLTGRPAGSAAALTGATTASPSFLVDRAGSYTASLIVNDGTVDSAADTVVISTTNTAPTANAGLDQTARVGDTIQLSGAASSDPDGNPLTYRWTLTSRPAGSAAALAGANTASPSFVIDQPGNYTASLIVNDGTVDSAADTVTVGTSNSAPTANAGPDLTVRVTDTVTLSGAASTDPDGNPLTYRWTLTGRPAGSAAALLNPNTLNPSFIADRPGNYTASLIVNDGTLDSAADSVTISTINSAPRANAGPDQTARVGDTVQLDGRGSSDVDGDALTPTWRVVSRPAGSTAALSATGVLQPSFTIDAAGSYVFELIVGDGSVNSAPDTVTVSTTNSPPVARPGNDRAVALGSTVALDGSASSDVDGNPLTFAWSLTSRPAGSAAVISSPTAVNASFVADLPGSYVVQLIANDGTVNSAPASLTVSTLNARPTANAGVDQTVPLGGLATLNGSASSDPEGAPLTYAWSLSSRPAGSTATLSAANVAGPSFTADRPGSYVGQLIVSDGSLNSLPDTVVISTLNSRPLANAGPAQAVNTGATVQLDGSASSDADGDALTYTWSLTTRPAGSNATLSSPGAVNPTFVADVPGSYVAQLIVADATLQSVPATVLITVTTPNRPPIAAAAATPSTVNVGSPVTLSSAGSSDPDGNALTYTWSLAARPAGSNASVVSPGAANTSFTPDLAGQYIVQLTVSDGSLSATAQATVTANAVAAQVNVPNVVALIEAQARAAVLAANLSVGSVTTASSATMPAGQVISQNPAAGATVPSGTPVALVVSTGAPAPGLAAIIVTPGNLLIVAGQGQLFAATGIYSDGTSLALSGAVTWSSSDPAVAGINSTGLASALAEGSSTVRATLGAISGSTQLTVLAAVADAAPPTATITAPVNGAVVTTVVNVTGTATDTNFLKYVLELAPAGTTTFTTLVQGNAPVSNGVLGVLNPTVLINDFYTLRLTVFDRGGNQNSTSRTVQVTRDEKVGKFTLAFEDLSVPMAGIPISVDRVYDSREKGVGDFGFGWRLDLQTMRIRANRVQGSAWTVTRSGGFFPTYTLVASEPHRVSVTLPDGKVEEFDLTVTPSSQQLLPLQFATASYTARAGTQGTLQVLGGTGLFVSGSQPGVVDLLDDGNFFSVWDPQSFVYTNVAGRQFVLDRQAGLRSVTDLNGNSLTFSAAGITHSSGKNVRFVRDAQGRITEMTDPKGGVSRYAYDANGDLASHTDALGNVTRYFYNLSHGLIEVRDPLGRRGIRTEYDDLGRLVAVIDARGNRQEFTHVPGARQELITDRNGNTSVLNYDDRGNVVSETNPLGGTITRTFSANGRVLTETSPLGHVTTNTYDANDNLLTRTNALGQVTTNTYNSRGQVLTSTDALGRVTTYTYDARGNELSVTDPIGRVLSSSFDARGNRLGGTDAIGGVHAYQVDGDGNRTRYTDPLGVGTAYTYDANGKKATEVVTRTDAAGNPVVQTTRAVHDAKNRLIELTDPLGHTERTEYDASGRVAANVDKLGRRKENVYDEVGRLIQTRHADGAVEAFEYDAEGNKTAITDPQGRTTRYEFDALKRLVRTVHPDGTAQSRTFDLGGRMVTETDEGGHTITHGYDAAGRRTSSTDALGAVTLFGYDAAGNRTSMTDALGRVTQYQYDGNNRRTRTTFADGSFIATTYDGAGRKATESDAAGRTTRYEYDAGGRLVRVIDALNRTTRYTYDEVGNKLSQTDAAGNVTRWAYDSLGRVTRLTRPLGMSESYSYDANGNLVGRTDFNGRTTQYSYDNATRERNRLVGKRYGDGSEVSSAYTPTGQVASVTDAGGTTRHAYDARDRLLSVTRPDGSVISYTYDARGNRLSVTAPAGVTRYTYDALNRLVEVTAPDGGITRHSHDAVGNRLATTRPNGTSTSYAYDSLNRLTSVTHRDAANNVIGSHAYTLSPTGHRIAVAEPGGRGVSYTYDALYRVTGETITDPVAGNAVLAYTYDAAGNRATRSNNGVTVNLLHDANQRLLQDGSTSYSYNANGNLVSKSVAGATSSYSYDFENRLLAEAGADGVHSYAYDDDGARRSATHAGVRVDYLVDKNAPLAQVLEERGADGGLRAHYVWGGAGLLSQTRGGVLHHFHHDALGSTRLLSNAAGAATDSATYDAWGNLLATSGSTGYDFRFAGEQFDAATGRYYLRARYYQPLTGNFITTDPLDGVDTNPLSQHKYIYANGDPVNLADPTGLFAMVSVSFSPGISIGLGAYNGIRLAFLLARVGVAVGKVAVAACALSSAVSAVSSVGSGSICDVTRYNVLFPGNEHPQTTRHIQDAIAVGFPANLNRRSPSVRGARYFVGSPCGAAATAGMACDEYPFASTDEGYPRALSLRLTPSWESSVQGGRLSAFYFACSVIPNNPWDGAFGVVPYGNVVPWVCK